MGNSEYDIIIFLFKNPDVAAVLGVFALILTIAAYFSNKKRTNVKISDIRILKSQRGTPLYHNQISDNHIHGQRDQQSDNTKQQTI